MSCCGGRRVQAMHGFAHQTPPRRPAQAMRYSHAFFQYVGTTALTVVGAATGTRYRFDSPGATVAIDFRDQQSLLNVPNLRRVNSP
jgi:hypothetical protein